jgi:uncharacterized protein YbjT (DUF2867 family)
MKRSRRFLPALIAGLCCTVAWAGAHQSAETVLVVGATGRTGKLIVPELITQGYQVRAFVRDAEKAREVLGPDVALVTGDLTDPSTIPPALENVQMVISAVGAGGGKASPEAVDYQGVKNLAEASAAADVQQIVLLSSMGVTHEDHPLNKMFSNVLIWKARGEQAVRDSGVPYTIVRPGGLVNEPADGGKVVGIQGDPRLDSAVIPRADVAKVCVAAIAEPAARNKTLEIIREDGEPVADWGGFFAALTADKN